MNMRENLIMKQIKILLLILCILALWSETALCSRIWPWAQDQNGNNLENAAHASQTYGGAACSATPTWVVYGRFTLTPSWTGCATCWAIDTFWVGDWAGYMNWPTNVCGDRYTFSTFAGDMTGSDPRSSQWSAGYTEPSGAFGIWDGISPGAIYNRNARVNTRKYLLNESTGQYGSLESSIQWLKVGEMKYHVPPNRESSNQYIGGVYHHGDGSSWSQPYSQIIANGGPYGSVQEEVNAATSPAINNYLDYYYNPGSVFTLTHDLPAQVTPVFTPAINTALFTGTRYFSKAAASLVATPIADGVDAQWMAVGWDGGSGRVAASGSIANNSTSIPLTANSTAATTINLKYLKHYRTTIVANDAAMPDWVRAGFESGYGVLGHTGSSIKISNAGGSTNTPYWLPSTASTIIIPEKISRTTTANNVTGEELWLLDKPALDASKPAWATISYDSATGSYRIQQTNQSAGWTCTIRYNKLTVGVSGIDDASHVTKLQGLPGLAPRLSANIVAGQETTTLGGLQLQAPNVVYAADSGNQNTIRYILTGWSGTGSLSAGGTSDAGPVTIVSLPVTAESSISWNYIKEIRVTVTTSGENDPLKVYEMPGNTTAGSATVTGMAVAWTETTDDNGVDLATPVRKSLAPGMLVWGYGIDPDTEIIEVSETSNSVTLSKAARFTMTQTAGQSLTFSTHKSYDRPGNTTNGSAVVSSIDTTALISGIAVSGPGIVDGTTILSIDSPTTLTLSENASLTRTANALAFGSADPRECQSSAGFTSDVCATRSGVNFYRVDTSIMPDSPPTQVSTVVLTVRNQFVEIDRDVDNNPIQMTRTLSQAVYPTSGVALATVQPQINGPRKALITSNLYKPMTVSWRYFSTKAFTIGQPLLPPADRNDIDRDKPPTITINTPALPGDTVDAAFVLAWDAATSTINITGNTTTGSAVISSIPSTAGFSAGMYVSGPGIAANSTIVSVDAPDQVTLSGPASQSGTAVALSVESRQGLRYFPIHPVTAFTINWPLKNSSLTVPEMATTIWPAKQVQIVGAPANLQPPGALNSFNAISSFPLGSTSAVISGIFTPDRAGTFILRFNTPKKAPDLRNGTAFIVVEASELRPEQYSDNDWTIGARITSASHSDPENRNGFLFYPGAMIDADGQDRAYDLATRTGAIIPVNEIKPGDINPLIIIWYETGQGGIGWPTSPMRYNPVWPAAPGTLTIGTGIPVSQTAKPRAMVYNQPDSSKPGFNPNEEHAILTGDSLYALRDDLNGIKNWSKAFVLLKYFDSALQEWKMDVYKVERPNSFTYSVEAGQPIVPPLPASFQMPPVSGLKAGAPGAEWYLRDQKGGDWAKAANAAGTSSFTMQWYYYMRPDFYWPYIQGQPAPAAGTPVPFLNNGPAAANFSAGALPIDVTYTTRWPATAPVLHVGETLTTARAGLPALYDAMTAEVVFDEHVYNGNGPLAKLYAPVRYQYATLAALPDIKTENVGGVINFPSLPFAIQARLFYDPAGKRLGFKGVWLTAENSIVTGAPNEASGDWLLPNLMTAAERDTIKAASGNTAWKAAVDALYSLARDPNNVSYPDSPINPFKPDQTYDFATLWGIKLGLMGSSPVSSRSTIGEKNALTAGMAQGEGYVVIAENNSSDLAVKDLPVALHVVKVAKSPVFQGVIKAIASKNVFDEKLTLHYTGDFGGEPERFTFEWYYQPVSGSVPPLPQPGAADTSWQKFMDPNNSTGAGQTDITIQGASPLTMSDNWVVARYYYKAAWPAVAVTSIPDLPATPHDDQNNWSLWSGANTIDTPMLAMGWVKRVIDGLNPLEARVTDFRNSATNTAVSMLSQFGNRYDGQIAFSSDPNYLNSLGLIPAYESVLNRARDFSIDAVPPQNYGPTNDTLMNITSRLATFYQALGNEAYADAVDPTIGFSTTSAEYGNMAPSVFAFQNQVDSLLEEELALMRGRDDSAGSTKNAPYYNRLIWNFTQGEGEVAYAQNYNITDQDNSGVINAGDARTMYPQGHGDAWGHYLQSINYYYKLLGHPSFSLEPRVEFVLVAGQPVMVDYLDERKFASIAAQRAKTGSEIVDLTYRKYFTDDPAGQWQGYKDSYTSRAWGVDEWSRRAGQAAYFDWVTANAMLPDSVPATAHDRIKYVTDPVTGILKPETIPGADIQQIDRSKVPELQDIASQFHKIQARMTEVDGGINPLGLVKGVVPFDIDPTQIDAGQTHFEQVYARAEKALENAIASYDYANGYTQRLRQNQDTLEDFKKNLSDQERDYTNRLIEIFGYPYPDDIGAGKTYPDGYDGPDLLHYNYVDRSELTGSTNPAAVSYTTYSVTYNLPEGFWNLNQGLASYVATPATAPTTVQYNINTQGNWVEKPPAWTSRRRAPGRVQQALSDLIQAKAAYDKGFKEYGDIMAGIEDAKQNLETRYNVLANQVRSKIQVEEASIGLDVAKTALHATSMVLRRGSDITGKLADAALEGIPDEVVVGTSSGGDVLAPTKTIVKLAVGIGQTVLEVGADVADMGEFTLDMVKERTQSGLQLNLDKSDASYEVWQLVKELQNSMSAGDGKLLELYSLKETIQQTAGNYLATLAEGIRVWDERTEKRKQSAADVQEYRFQDLGFRVFRNDAIQKYRAQFDLAAKYVYLAATAYDYETNLLGSASGAGRKFLTEIGRQRTLGVVSNGVPQAGFPGLADTMARLSQNFSVYKSQLGFNNPQTETTPFSLRTELFRIKADAVSNADWRSVLKDHKVDDLWKIPEFKRYCRPFAPESAGPQPGIVIKFPTTVTYGKNFFGWPLSGGDSAYSTSNFSTRVRSVGLWFQNYNNAGLSSTPRVYLVPTGSDILRSPTGDGFATREWLVKDQKLPVPFPIGDTDLKNPSFIPANDSLSDEFAGIRRVSDFRAYPYSGAFDPSQATSDSRLIGRSVWNSQWMLIIPGSTLLFNKDVGLNTFINSVDDIKMFFQTYAYSGN